VHVRYVCTSAHVVLIASLHLKASHTTRRAQAVLKGYEEREAAIRQRADAFNTLESYIYVTKEKLESNEEIISVTTKEMRESFTDKLNKASLYLDFVSFLRVAQRMNHPR
jgi:hypothetical protein